MVKMPRFETSCLETGIKTPVTETGQQLPPSQVTPLWNNEVALYGLEAEKGTEF